MTSSPPPGDYYTFGDKAMTIWHWLLIWIIGVLLVIAFMMGANNKDDDK